MPSNFRTYEAQSRLLAAVLASHPGLKLNFKESGLEHRFRPIKKQVAVVRRAVADGKDAKDVANIFHMNDKDIAKYFGESTPQGIEFQFRSIRKDAKALRDAVDKGESPLAVRRTAVATGPSMRKRRAAPGGAGAGAGAGAGNKTPAKKRSRAEVFVLSNEEDSAGSDEVDWEAKDPTPEATPTKSATRTPAGRMAVAMGATNAGVAVPFTPSLATEATTTPALSTGTATTMSVSPHNGSPAAPGFDRAALYGVGRHEHSIRTVDEDEDDDDVFVVDTPSKVLKVEEEPYGTSAQSTMTLGHSGNSDRGGMLGAWNSSNNHGLARQSGTSSSPSQALSLVDSGASWASMPDPFLSGDGLSSFAHSAAPSFYDNDGAI
ncbi:hypothetical protein SPI_05146 [Niveomyces insectorum RCEF 264]|uniref:Uncharacterized protein n=1 Tax=Niveomyces insectorum RCEF 264 TaxID=1081102 RepID=A0A167TZW2_9HYPO|nr:hypothetical protein SPI_05146 [Niveomyces insectorum RCEF 264]